MWTWEIPLYFFFGGMAGAAAPFALMSELRGDEALARKARGWSPWPARRRARPC